VLGCAVAGTQRSSLTCDPWLFVLIGILFLLIKYVSRHVIKKRNKRSKEKKVKIASSDSNGVYVQASIDRSIDFFVVNVSNFVIAIRQQLESSVPNFMVCLQ
jgi:hypothetical protein